MTTGPHGVEFAVGEEFCRQMNLPAAFCRDIDPRDEMYQHLAMADWDSGAYRFHYYRTGYESLLAVRNVLATAGRDLRTEISVLDFACGYGRFARYLALECGADKVWGSDIYHDGVDFVKEKLGIHGLYSQTSAADLDFGRTFDVIFVASLFSHLPRHRFVEWLRALHAALSPNGLLLFSTHGPTAEPQIPRDPSGFTFVQNSESGSLSLDEYGSTFVSEAATRQLAREAGIAHLYAIERELWSLQDLYVASKQALPDLEDLRPSHNILGRLDRLQISAVGEFMAEGWAANVPESGPLQEVNIEFDGGRQVCACAVGIHRPDVSKALNRPDWTEVGWRVSGQLQDVDTGSHFVLATGRAGSGLAMPFDAITFAALPFDSIA